MCRELLQLFQKLDSTTQKIRSRAVSRGRSSRAFHTASCCRSARFSSANSRCVPTVDRSVRRRIPSHLTMAGQIARSVPQTQENRDGRLFRKDRPQAEDQEMQILTPPEIRRLLDAADEPVRTLLLCAVLTGMRRGELLGLRWEDIDLEGHRIFVRRALWRGKFVTPKSRRSRRTIDLAPTLRAALARLPSRFQSGLVFCSPDGEPINPDTFAQRDWARALRRAGLRRVRFHDLRHTYASLLIAQGAHPKYIQAQLGHASTQTTLDRYGHLMPDAHAAEAQKLDELVFGSPTAPPARRLPRYASDGRRVGAKWEQSPSQREIMGAKWEQTTRKG